MISTESTFGETNDFTKPNAVFADTFFLFHANPSLTTTYSLFGEEKADFVSLIIP